MEVIQSDGSDRFDDIVSKRVPGKIKQVKYLNDGVEFTCENNVVLRVHVLTDNIIRFRYAFGDEFQSDFSYAIADDAPKPKSVRIHKFPQDYMIDTPSLFCRISHEGLLVSIFNKAGEAICEDAAGFYQEDSLMKGIYQVKVTKKSPTTESYFGLGDKASALNLRGRTFENWCTDSFGYKADTDPLYRAIPFYYAMNNGKTYGIFMDNTFRTHFSFDAENDGTTSFWADGGEMNYYFIYGPTPQQVSQQYMQLTGKPEMPPLWAFGYHQCRWSYFPDSVVTELAQNFRQKRIPCDAIYLDIDYMDGYRCFTWDMEHFPNPKQLIDYLRVNGFQTVVMIDPGIKVDKNYFVYKQGKENAYFCRRPDGGPMKGPVWPPECVFPDFTHPQVRNWWGTLYEDLYNNKGVSGFWNDMNEPAVFEVESKTFPLDIRHQYEGHFCSHKKAHNIYGMQMTRATYNGLKKLKPEKRPFVLTRATYAGGQRFASAWTGDNIATWEHLHIANIQAQRMSISGFSLIGSDIGGFAENPTGELFARWLQLSIFHPLMRAHSMGYNVDGGATIDEGQVKENEASGKILDQEPWAYGKEFTDINRATIELRYRLIPYLYTAFYEYVNKGIPVLKPLSFYAPNDAKSVEREEEFIFGNQILVSPVSQPKATTKEVYLPKGNWYHYYTSEKYNGEQTITVDAPLDQIPFFIKGGSVIPMSPVIQHTQEFTDTLILKVYFEKGLNKSTLYQDEGDGYGNNLITDFVAIGSSNSLFLQVHKKGIYEPLQTKTLIEFHGVPFEVNTCTVDGEEVVIAGNTLILENDFKEIVLR